MDLILYTMFLYMLSLVILTIVTVVTLWVVRAVCPPLDNALTDWECSYE